MGGGLGLNGRTLPEITPGTGTGIQGSCLYHGQLKDLTMTAISQTHSGPRGHAGKAGLPAQGMCLYCSNQTGPTGAVCGLTVRLCLEGANLERDSVRGVKA